MNEGKSLALRIEAVIQRVFKLRSDQLRDDTRRGDVERWDSLGHLTLIEALRKTLAVEISPEQALDMETVADVKRIVTDLVNGESPP